MYGSMLARLVFTASNARTLGTPGLVDPALLAGFLKNLTTDELDAFAAVVAETNGGHDVFRSFGSLGAPRPPEARLLERFLSADPGPFADDAAARAQMVAGFRSADSDAYAVLVAATDAEVARRA